jgi:hypothetical protein
MTSKLASLDPQDRQTVQHAAKLLGLGLADAECIAALAGYSNPRRDDIVSLATAIAARAGVHPAYVADRATALDAGSRLLALGFTTPELLDRNFIDPAITDRVGLLFAIRKLATVRRRARGGDLPRLPWEVRDDAPPPGPNPAAAEASSLTPASHGDRPLTGVTAACVQGLHQWKGQDIAGRPYCTACGLTSVVVP